MPKDGGRKGQAGGRRNIQANTGEGARGVTALLEEKTRIALPGPRTPKNDDSEGKGGENRNLDTLELVGSESEEGEWVCCEGCAAWR